MFKDLPLGTAFLKPKEQSVSNDEDLVFLLGIEGGPVKPEWTLGERVLDSLVKKFQPDPVFVHVELFLMPSSADQETTFATYLGREAGWGSSEPDTSFYLNSRNSWRAFPVRSPDLAHLSRIACEAETGAPYSLARYLTSVFPARMFAPLLPSSAGSPAHCATLSARILKTAGVALPRTAAWYSPSTLWIELSRPSRVDLMRSASSPRTRPLVETEHSQASAETLIRGSDDAVRCMTDAQCRSAVALLESRVLGATESVGRVVAERQLACGLLRWGEIVRKKDRKRV